MSAVRTDEVKKDLEYIATYRDKIAPHRFNSNQSIVADLVVKEAKRLRKILEK